MYLPILAPGRCMCVRWYVSPDRVVYLLAGFEDGSVVLWDCRNNTSELTTLKLFSEPGNIHEQYALHLITSAHANQLETCVFVNGYLSFPGHPRFGLDLV